MHHIRVVLSNMPRLLQDIVNSILVAEPEIDVETLSLQLDAPSSATRLHEADVVIVPEPELERMDYEALLYEHPRLSLVAVSADGRNAALYGLRPYRQPLGELSPQALVDTVRAHNRTRGAG